MSDHESFSDVIERINCEIAEIDATDRPFPYRLSSNVLRDLRDRLQAAHEREMHNPSHKYMRDERARYEHDLELMGQYHRGYDDGRRSMDAEHALIAMRLKDVPLTDWGHENLNRMAYAIYPCSTGWTKESCKGLVERLVHLLGGDGIEIDSLCKHDGSGGVRPVVVSSEQEQVTYDVLGNERHKAVCKLRKLSKCSMGSHGFRDGLAAAIDVPEDNAPYDDKELCGLICDRLIHLLGGDQPTLSDLYGIWKDSSDFANPNDEADAEFAKNGKNCEIGQDNWTDNGTCPNDVPMASITDELRKWMEHGAHYNEIGHGVVKKVYIPWFGRKSEIEPMLDRIDEQFARCCELWERVTTEQVSKRIELEDESDELLDLLRDAARDYKSLKVENDSHAEMSAGFSRQCGYVRVMLEERMREQSDAYLDLIRDAAKEYEDKHHWAQVWHDRAENMREERDYIEKERKELQDELEKTKELLEISYAKRRALQTHIDQMQGGSKRLREEINELKGKLEKIGAIVNVKG